MAVIPNLRAAQAIAPAQKLLNQSLRLAAVAFAQEAYIDWGNASAAWSIR